MGIRLPIQTVLDYNDSGNVGATSIVSKTFVLPQDTDSVIMKVPVTSISGTAPVVDVFLQTSDDGGSTWYDCANIRPTSTVISSVLFVNNATAMFAGVPVIVGGGRSNSSVTGNTSASSLGANQYSGLPIMGTVGRVSIKYSGTITTNNGMQVQVKTAQQSATA